VKVHALAALAAAGCITGSQAPYPVDGVAQLEPMNADAPYITGPIEVLGTGMPRNVDPGVRTFAAYHVQLPDHFEVLVALESAASCADREPLTAPDDPIASQLLGYIRRVGDEAHFFAPSVPIGGGYVTEVDTETTVAYASPNARFPRVVVAVAPGDSDALSCGVLTWR
jgi:hypothetical protein